jgi:hypothetical protein
MATKSVEALVEDFRILGEERHDVVQAVRALIKKSFPTVVEEVKYGGILFAADTQFCGVFAYKEHVSVEFSSGAAIKDAFGYLEGSGKFRRHLKLANIEDLKIKQLKAYLQLALVAAKNSI